jgi:hypothetical protein
MTVRQMPAPLHIREKHQEALGTLTQSRILPPVPQAVPITHETEAVDELAERVYARLQNRILAHDSSTTHEHAPQRFQHPLPAGTHSDIGDMYLPPYEVAADRPRQ